VPRDFSLRKLYSLRKINFIVEYLRELEPEFKIKKEKIIHQDRESGAGGHCMKIKKN
jgi:hypothetical protein